MISNNDTKVEITHEEAKFEKYFCFKAQALGMPNQYLHLISN